MEASSRSVVGKSKVCFLISPYALSFLLLVTRNQWLFSTVDLQFASFQKEGEKQTGFFRNTFFSYDGDWRQNECLFVWHCRMSQGGEGRGEHTRQGNSDFVSWETPNADYANEKKKSLRVRYVYSIIFLITNLIAWFLRDYGQRILPQLHCKENFFHLSIHFHFTSTTL